MKKCNTALLVAMLCLQLFVPTCRVIAAIVGYRFVLRSAAGTVVAIAAVSLAMTVALGVFRRAGTFRGGSVCAAWLLPVAVCSSVCYFDEIGSPTVYIPLLCSVACAVPVAVWFLKGVARRAFLLIGSGMLATVVCFFAFLYLIFSLGSDTVIRTVESPSGAYTAVVIDCDQGALGGAPL